MFYLFFHGLGQSLLFYVCNVCSFVCQPLLPKLCAFAASTFLRSMVLYASPHLPEQYLIPDPLLPKLFGIIVYCIITTSTVFSITILYGIPAYKTAWYCISASAGHN
jgi:hypothetical protein